MHNYAWYDQCAERPFKTYVLRPIYTIANPQYNNEQLGLERHWHLLIQIAAITRYARGDAISTSRRSRWHFALPFNTCTSEIVRLFLLTFIFINC